MYYLFLYDEDEKLWITKSSYETKNAAKKNFDQDINYDADKLGIVGVVSYKIIKATGEQEDDAFNSSIIGNYSMEDMITSGAKIIEENTYVLKNENDSELDESQDRREATFGGRSEEYSQDVNTIQRLALKEVKNGWAKMLLWLTSTILSAAVTIALIKVKYFDKSEEVSTTAISIALVIASISLFFYVRTERNRADVKSKIAALTSRDLEYLNECRSAIMHSEKIQSLRYEITALHGKIEQSTDPQEIGYLRGRLARAESTLRQMGA